MAESRSSTNSCPRQATRRLTQARIQQEQRQVRADDLERARHQASERPRMTRTAANARTLCTRAASVTTRSETWRRRGDGHQGRGRERRQQRLEGKRQRCDRPTQLRPARVPLERAPGGNSPRFDSRPGPSTFAPRTPRARRGTPSRGPRRGPPSRMRAAHRGAPCRDVLMAIDLPIVSGCLSSRSAAMTPGPVTEPSFEGS